MVREIVRRVLAGESLISITLDLNQRGVPSPGAGMNLKRRANGQNAEGSRWNKTSVKKIALRKANIGVRAHTVDGQTTEYPAAWPALITPEQHARVTALLTARATGGVKPSSQARPGIRKHMLSWTEVGTCGECASWLKVAKRGNSKHGTPAETYVCEAPTACVGRNKAHVDQHVSDVVVALLSNARGSEAFRPDESAAMAALEKVAGLKARQAVAADDYAAGVITREQLLRINQSMGPQIAEAQAEANRLAPKVDLSVIEGLVGPRAEAAWEALGVAQKTQVLEALQLRVTLLKVGRTGPGYNKDSVRIERLGVKL